MKRSGHIDDLVRLCWRSPARTLGIVAAIGLVGLLKSDLIMSSEYLPARVIAVHHVPGGGVTRQVVVDLGTHDRSLVTGEWMVRTVPDEMVCIRHDRRLLRQWVRHRIVLPGYCALVGLPGQPLAEDLRAPYD
jgi:hypothetical protein